MSYQENNRSDVIADCSHLLYKYGSTYVRLGIFESSTQGPFLVVDQKVEASRAWQVM